MSIVSTSGTIFTFCNVHLENFHNFLTSGDLNSLKSAQEEIKVETVLLNIDRKISTCFTNLDHQNQVNLLIATDKTVYQVSPEDDEESELMDVLDNEVFGEASLVKLLRSNIVSNYMFCLDSK